MLTDGWTTDAGVTGILIAHLGAFGSGELKKLSKKFPFKCIRKQRIIDGLGLIRLFF